jgi:predicted DNA-binding protein (MmcQ/YjbR family)
VERVKSAEELAILERLRQLCGTLPEVEESVDGHGHTSFRVAGKPFVMMGSMRLWLGIKSDPISQDVLVRSGRWVRGQHGWVSVADFGALDWEEIEELVRDAWRLTAPKRLVKPAR